MTMALQDEQGKYVRIEYFNFDLVNGYIDVTTNRYETKEQRENFDVFFEDVVEDPRQKFSIDEFASLSVFLRRLEDSIKDDVAVRFSSDFSQLIDTSETPTDDVEIKYVNPFALEYPFFEVSKINYECQLRQGTQDTFNARVNAYKDVDARDFIVEALKSGKSLEHKKYRYHKFRVSSFDSSLKEILGELYKLLKTKELYSDMVDVD